MQLLKNSFITSLKLTFEASAIIEKLIWICFAILGSTYFVYLIISQVTSWEKHSVLASKWYYPISEIDFPAVTFCTRANTKYAIAERIGNSVDLNSEIVKEKFLPLRNVLIQNVIKEGANKAENNYHSDCTNYNFGYSTKTERERYCEVRK